MENQMEKDVMDLIEKITIQAKLHNVREIVDQDFATHNPPSHVDKRLICRELAEYIAPMVPQMSKNTSVFEDHLHISNLTGFVGKTMREYTGKYGTEKQRSKHLLAEAKYIASLDKQGRINASKVKMYLIRYLKADTNETD